MSPAIEQLIAIKLIITSCGGGTGVTRIKFGTGLCNGKSALYRYTYITPHEGRQFS